MKVDVRACVLAVGLSFITSSGNAQVLLNGGFETGTGSNYIDAADPSLTSTGAANWVQYDNGIRVSTNDTRNALTARSGSYSLECFGVGMNLDGAYQVISNGVTPGQTYVFSGYSLILSSDPLTNTSSGFQPFGYLQIGFQDNSGSNLLFYTSALVLTTNGVNTWISSVVTGVAPPTASQIDVYAMELSDGNEPSGSIYWDDMNVSVVPEPSSLFLVLMGLCFLLSRAAVKTRGFTL